MKNQLVGLCAWFLLSLMTLCGCEYVRPTLNAPLKQWEPAGGYRFSNLAPPEADNTDGLFIMASFSGGGTRASTLAFGVLRELARQQITWEGKKKRLLDELDAMFALSGGTFTAGYYLGRLGGYSDGLGRAVVGAAGAIGVRDRLWTPDFRDRMLVIARRD